MTVSSAENLHSTLEDITITSNCVCKEDCLVCTTTTYLCCANCNSDGCYTFFSHLVQHTTPTNVLLSLSRRAILDKLGQNQPVARIELDEPTEDEPNEPELNTALTVRPGRQRPVTLAYPKLPIKTKLPKAFTGKEGTLEKFFFQVEEYSHHIEMRQNATKSASCRQCLTARFGFVA